MLNYTVDIMHEIPNSLGEMDTVRCILERLTSESVFYINSEGQTRHIPSEDVIQIRPVSEDDHHEFTITIFNHKSTVWIDNLYKEIVDKVNRLNGVNSDEEMFGNIEARDVFEILLDKHKEKTLVSVLKDDK